MEERDEKKGRKEMEEGNEKKMEEKNDGQRKKAIDRVTIGGSMVNGVLLVFKFVAGVLGGSAASRCRPFAERLRDRPCRAGLHPVER